MKRKQKLLFGCMGYSGSIGKKKKDPNEVKDAKPPSRSAMAVRLKFALVNRFLSKAKGLIKMGYTRKIRCSSTEMNFAVQHTLRNAITGEFPNFSIDYPKLVLSKGKLDQPWGINMLPLADSSIRINWVITRYPNKQSQNNDSVMVFLYCDQTDQGIEVEHAAKRDDLGVTLKLDAGFAGCYLHVWFFFMSDNEKLASNSVYLGEMKLVE